MRLFADGLRLGRRQRRVEIADLLGDDAGRAEPGQVVGVAVSLQRLLRFEELRGERVELALDRGIGVFDGVRLRRYLAVKIGLNMRIDELGCKVRIGGRETNRDHIGSPVVDHREPLAIPIDGGIDSRIAGIFLEGRSLSLALDCPIGCRRDTEVRLDSGPRFGQAAAHEVDAVTEEAQRLSER